MKNDQSSHKLQFQSLKLHKMSKLVPEGFKMNEMSTLVLGKPKIFTNDPWIKVFYIWQILPLKFKNWQNKSLGIQNLEISQNTLVLFMNLQNGTI